jgi:N6-adenosine-specific RNA methylase IME4
VRYATIVADPPWRYTSVSDRKAGRGAPAEAHYPTMTTELLASLPVGNLALENAHLYLWVTNPVLTEQRVTTMGSVNAPALCRAWGFEPKTLITWIKGSNGEVNGGGMGWFFRGATEHVIFAVRGRCPIPAHLRVPNVVIAPRGQHSQKPDAFMDMVESVSPGPYLEMFARRQRIGWDTYGDQALEHVVLGT